MDQNQNIELTNNQVISKTQKDLGVTVLGISLIIWFILRIIIFGVWAGSIFFASAMNVATVSNEWKNVFTFVAYFCLPLVNQVILLIAAIGIIMRRKWGLTTFIIFVVSDLLYVILVYFSGWDIPFYLIWIAEFLMLIYIWIKRKQFN